MKLVSRVEESLGGNAANIEAGTTEGSTLLDAHGLEALLASLDSGDVATWTATNFLSIHRF